MAAWYLASNWVAKKSGGQLKRRRAKKLFCDEVCHSGGEEVAIFLLETKISTAKVLAEPLRLTKLDKCPECQLWVDCGPWIALC